MSIYFLSDFIVKYLSSVVESDSKIYIEEDGTIHGATAKDLEALNGATITANGNASDVEFIVENGVVKNADTFLRH